MFHLLVRSSGWSKGTQTFNDPSRVLESSYTKRHLIQRFRPHGKLDESGVLKRPVAILASEIGDSGPQQAMLCRITGVRDQGAWVEFDYERIPGMATIPNHKLVKLADQLDFGPYDSNWGELEREHWAIKDVNLFEVLLRDAYAEPVTGLLKFSEAVDPKLVAVMMPFDASFNGVYAAIQAAAKSRGLKCRRADDIWKHQAVIDDITTLISGAHIVVCDYSQQNTNVFYETGIAHAINKKHVPIAQHESDVPFNVRHHRWLGYLNNAQGLEDLTEKLAERLKTLLKED